MKKKYYFVVKFDPRRKNTDPHARIIAVDSTNQGHLTGFFHSLYKSGKGNLSVLLKMIEWGSSS